MIGNEARRSSATAKAGRPSDITSLDRSESRREHRLRRTAALAAALAVLLTVPGRAAALSPGPEIPLGVPVHAVAPDPGGGFTVTGGGSDGDTSGIFVWRFDALGTPLGGEIPVNVTTADQQSNPAIAADPGGGITVAWQSLGQDGSANGIYARRFDVAGNPLSGEIPINATTAGNQCCAAIAPDGEGGFSVAWMSVGQDGSGDGVYARRFDAAGEPLGGEVAVNATTAGDQSFPTLTTDPDGGFTVAWQGLGGEYSDVFARRFDVAGNPLSGEIPVNVTTAGSQVFPSIAADGSGGFIVAWTSLEGQDELHAFVRRFDAAGAPLSGEIAPNLTSGQQVAPVIATDPSGGFTVAWTAGEEGGSAPSVFARRFDAAGAPLSGEIPVSPEGGSVAVVTDGDGGFTVFYGNDGPFEDGAFARRFVNAPDTQIDSGPPKGSATNDPTPTFGFSSDEEPANFECRFDAEPFAACSGPGASHTPSADLTDGPHTFEVRAVDAAANADPWPASRGFTVDATPPDTSIDSGPAGPTNDSTPTFGFSSEAGAVFECQLDGGGYSACSSPLTTAPLADGPHALEVRATDQVGNTEPSPASRDFTIDTVAPDTQIDSGPTGPTNDPTPTFAFSSNEAASFECRLDGAPFSACTSPLTTAPLPDAPHSFEVRATDQVGHTDPSPASRSFAVDTAVSALPASPLPDTTVPALAALPPDTLPPNVKLFGKRRQKAGKPIEIVASCAEDCALIATGRVVVSGAPKSGAARAARRPTARFKLRKVARQLSAGHSATLKLRLKSKKAKRRLGRLVRSGRKARGKVTVNYSDRAGNASTARLTIRLRSG